MKMSWNPLFRSFKFAPFRIAPVLLVLPSSDVKIYTSTLTNKIDGVITNQIIATLKHDTLKTKILETHEYITSYQLKYIDENQYFISIGVNFFLAWVLYCYFTKTILIVCKINQLDVQ